uniref:NELF-A N-terminal domain-containing protein n=1 Tax=Phytophthora ramorum TaxID=164328 RepID=H3H269_PHYRM
MVEAAASTPSSFDAWLLQKLRLEWSSREFGGLLTAPKLAEARGSFPHLETPIKVRLLLSLLSIRRDEADAAAGQKEVDALLRLAESDAEEWVKVSGGIVKQFLVLQADGQPADSYLHSQLEATASKVLQVVASSPKKRRSGGSSQVALDDFFSLENGLLNASLRPQVAPATTTHFTVSGEDDDAHGKEDEVSESPVKKPLHRPQMARPLGASGAMAASTATTASTVTRLTQAAAKPPVGKKKNLTELSSEIRRKADAGRFKRQRSRISMIDINEVKQIESEKAQKAEERKKQKLAAKEKEKEKAKEKEKEKTGAAAPGVTASTGDKSGALEEGAASTVNEEHAAIAADIFAMHQQPGPDESVQQYSQQPLQPESITEQTEVNQGEDGDDYVPDGTQALLNAAFHSTQDIMKEVVSQQNQQMQGQHQPIQQQQLQPPVFQDLYRTQQQMQMHHLAPPQPQYHQGFEPEDATINSNATGGLPMGFGGYGYGSTAGYYGDQFGNYGTTQDPNVFGSAGSSSNNSNNSSSRQQQQLQQQQQQQQQQNNGGYMGGSGEYWR